MKNRCLPNLETVFQAVLIPHQAIFVQSVHAAQNVPFFDLYVYRRERGVLCRFARFPFSRRASPAASSPPSADAVSSPSSKQRQRRHLSFPSQCHHCTAEGRKAGTRPYRLPYSHLIQSAAHRQIGRKRQQHQICTHRRRQAEHDRPHRQSPLLHSIALPIPVVQKSVCRKAAFYIQALEKSAQKSAGHSAGAFASG